MSGASVPRLRKLLERAEARVEKLERVASPGDEVSKSFHLGMVGGSGRQVRRLNTRKAAALDRIIDAAVALPKARQRVSEIRARIARAEAPPAPVAPPSVKQKRPRRHPAPLDLARLREVRRWYLYGDADESPPFEDITQAEIERATRLPREVIAPSLAWPEVPGGFDYGIE